MWVFWSWLEPSADRVSPWHQSYNVSLSAGCTQCQWSGLPMWTLPVCHWDHLVLPPERVPGSKLVKFLKTSKRSWFRWHQNDFYKKQNMLFFFLHCCHIVIILICCCDYVQCDNNASGCLSASTIRWCLAQKSFYIFQIALISQVQSWQFCTSCIMYNIIHISKQWIAKLF